MTNIIDASAEIDPRVRLGHFNKIGRNVQIRIVGADSTVSVEIGDNNIINDSTRLLVGSGNVLIGDWNVFHNDVLLIGGKKLLIGHNCWFGQNTVLDGSGELTLGNGVRVGMYSQIWSHVASGELIEGCTLFAFRPTVIEDDVWLVGSCTVSSGVRIAKRTIALSQSNITKDTSPNTVYAGCPAVQKEKFCFYRDIAIHEKARMILEWVEEFARRDARYRVEVEGDGSRIKLLDSEENSTLVFGANGEGVPLESAETFFDLERKTYTKRNTELERNFYRSIYGNRARFLPVHT